MSRRSLLDIFLFGSSAERIPGDGRLQLQTYRLLTLLGAVLTLVLGTVYAASRPGGTDPFWARAVVSGLFAILLAGSYASRWLRDNYVAALRASLYVFLAWFGTVAALNGFAGPYDVGILLTYALLPAIVGLGTRSIGPVLRLLAFGLAVVIVGAFARPPQVDLLSLLASMGAIALVETVVIRRLLSTRRQLRERQAHLHGLANSIPGVVYQFYARPDGSYGLYYVSDRAESILGISPDPDGFFDRFAERVPSSHREELFDSIDAAVESSSCWQFEMPFDRPGGKRIWLLGTSTPEEREDEIVFNGVILDITERKETDRALRAERDRLTRFASVLSHDLQNPLNVAGGRLRLAREEGGSTEDNPGHLAAVERALNRMGEIIDDVLLISWSRQKVEEEELTACNLGQVAADCWENVETGGASLQVDNGAYIVAGERRLLHLLENLFRNAVEHGGEAPTVRVGALEDGFFVEDDGPGIPPEDREDVFEEGYSSREEGTGLGLSIAKTIAEAHGWTLSATSGTAGGARFEIRGVRLGAP